MMWGVDIEADEKPLLPEILSLSDFIPYICML